tara:strand:+ start:113 stop:1150 length:1038 start_codon:yes stop_codon:yes gene_type:complete
MLIREFLLKISDEYKHAKKQPFKDHSLANYIRSIPKLIHNYNKLPNSQWELELGNFGSLKRYKISASPGQGNWSDVPWIAFMDESITTSAEKGYYVVYLFAPDGKSIILGLGQGEYSVRKEFKRKANQILAQRADIIASRNPLFSSYKFKRELKGFNYKNNDKVRENWISSFAFGKVYQTKNLKKHIPNDNNLMQDLVDILKLYQQSIYNGGWSIQEDDKIDYDIVDNDLKIQEQMNIKYHKTVERNQALIRQVKKIKGYNCEACGLNFKKIYGNFSEKDFIEAHHLTPLSQLKGQKPELSPKEDFAVLCSNCHRMIHRYKLTSIDSFKEKISDEFKNLMKKLNK